MEILIALVIMGIMMVLISPGIQLLASVDTANYRERQNNNNRLIAAALLLWAKNNTQLGQLPAPYSGGGYSNTVFDPSDTSTDGVALQTLLQQQGVNLLEVNDDNYAARRVRAYQRLSGLTYSMPLYVRSGPLVTLAYDYGVIYQTPCLLENAACNPGALGQMGLPSSSSALNASNYSSWAVTGDDFGTAFVSTLPLQESMLAMTVQRLETIRASLWTYVNAKRLSAAAADTTNWNPLPTGGGAPDLSGGNPATNQGCYNGWYALNAAIVNILPQIGLGKSEYGVTAWGGRIEYCQDYDLVAGGAGIAPHYAALRLHQSVSTAAAPDAAVSGNNIFITF